MNKPKFDSRHFRKIHVSHQAARSTNTDVDAIVRGKKSLNLRWANTSLSKMTNLENKLTEFLILNSSRRKFFRKVFVIGAAVHFKDMTKKRDSVLKTKGMNSH